MKEKVIKVAEILQTARVQKGFTLEEIAEKARLKPRTLKNIETGVFSPTSEILYSIADAIGIKIKINNIEI